MTKIQISEELLRILNILEEENSYIAYEMLYLAEYSHLYDNPLGIEKIDIGKNDYFTITVANDEYEARIGKIIKYFFKNLYSNQEIADFKNLYNNIKEGKMKKSGQKVQITDFSYNPKDIRSTFLSMVSKTYPHGHEEEVLKFLPKLNKDKFGNYFIILGDTKTPETMFTSHLDTADRKQTNTNIFSKEIGNDEFLYTDGTTILGADDKAGVSIMLYMMANNVSGLYYFFIGEERGGIGSNKLSSEFETIDYLKNIKRCVSFDRRKTGSVITSQLGRICCSKEFATELCNQYNQNGMEFSMDPTGVYTDSASFIDQISECTNISVGYENEHTGREIQNITFLKKVAEATIKIDWDKLPTVRSVSINKEILKKHFRFIKEVKNKYFGLEMKFTGHENKVYLSIDMDEVNINSAHRGLIQLQTLMKIYKIDDNVLVEDGYIDIELK
jgi:hypothetical protein